MKETAIITVRLFEPNKKEEHDIEIPLSISAYDLYVAINEAYRLERDTSVKDMCILKADNPNAVLVGDRSLSDYNIRDGSIINVFPANYNYDQFNVESVNSSDNNESIGAMHYPEFVRNSRLKLTINTEPIPLLGPKDKQTKPKNNLLLKLMPALGMIALTVLLRGVMGGTNLSFILFSVCSVSMGAIVSTISIINDNKEYKKQCVERQIGYRQYIDRMDKEIAQMRQDELQLLNRIYYRYDETSQFALNFSGSLFDRIPADDDFLEVRLGIGTIDAARKIEYKPPEKYESDDDELVDLPIKLAEKYKKLENAPILIQLKNSNVIGVVGDDNKLYEMMKIIFFDVCVRQHYDDVSVALLIDEKDTSKYGWVKWMKHIQNNGFRNIVCDSQSKATVFEYLYAEFNRRETSRDKSHLPHIVVFVMNDCGIKEHPLSKYIENASEYGATFIFFENSKDYVPLGCTQLVLVDSDKKGRIIKNQNTEIVDFRFIQIDDADLYKISTKLAPVYCQEVSLESALTKNISLYQLLNINSEEDLNLNIRWAKSDATKSLAAPIGVRSGDEIVSLDISDDPETGHGPHGLVAGTTGSGKSEVLMTYILSMATLYSPYEVAFLIIDFKGGGMGNQFKNLPHTLGVITDIDGKEINRSLISIKAEIERRKKLFAEADVDHINKYISAWKKKKVTTPLPHLIIIVDEFAELKAQYGDFMSELNSAARVGRSLGVHLILATQKPQGQVDPQIDSNSKFRLCLKVQTPEDSREVIKSPLAAEIREAGRAYLLVGNNEIFELFQSAYSGAPTGIESNIVQQEFCISAVDFAGRRDVVFQRKHRKPSEGETITTQKDAVTQWIVKFFTEHKLPKLPDICQPPLERLINYSKCSKEHGVGIYTDLGIFDDPANQRQEKYVLNLSMQNVLIIGALQTGKTNVIQLIIRDIAENYSSTEVAFYAIDYSSMILTSFQELNHMGGVVLPNESEKLNNLLKMLTNEIVIRRQKFNSLGVTSFSAYKEAGYKDMPMMILFIDGFTALKERSLGDNSPLVSPLIKILEDGLAVGICVIVANNTTKTIESRYYRNFGCRIGLYHNNTEEYGNLFDVYKIVADSIPGRGKVRVDNSILDCQFYMSFEGDKEIDRVQSIRSFCKQVNKNNVLHRAQQIPEIPKTLVENNVWKQFDSYYSGYEVILGFDYETLKPKTISLSGLNMVVSGTPQSGKGNFTKYLISCLNNNRQAAPVEIFIFDKASIKKLERISCECVVVKRYEMSTDNMAEICKTWKAELERREQLVKNNSGDMSVLDNVPLLFMICEDSSKEMLEGFDHNLFKYLPYKFSWLASSTVNLKVAAIDAPKIYKAKGAGAGFMFFGNIGASKTIDEYTSIQNTDTYRKLKGIETAPGDAFYIDSRDATKIYRLKTILHQDNPV